MKKIFIILLITVLPALFFSSCESNDNPIVKGNPYITADNKVLVEIFTNTSCIPCVSANTYMDGINNNAGVTSIDTNVIIVRFHTTLFANDPYYNFNVTDNFARQQFYNAGLSNPRGYLMGTSMGSFNSSNWTTSINNRLAVQNSMGFNFTVNYDTASRNGTVNLTLAQVSGSALSDLVLHIAIVENGLIMTPPAPNGETDFENTFRQFVTQPNGDAISISPGQSLTFVKNFNLMNGINPADSYIVIFVQSTSTKEVFGAAKKNLM
jgi:hypothetical protein